MLLKRLGSIGLNSRRPLKLMTTHVRLPCFVALLGSGPRGFERYRSFSIIIIGPKSSDNPNSVAHQCKIIWQNQIRLKMPSRRHVDENAGSLQGISEKLGF